MILPDVNVLVYSHREDAPEHPRYRHWLEAILTGKEPYAISDHVLSGFLRFVTHPRFLWRPNSNLAFGLTIWQKLHRFRIVKNAKGIR
jgi:predicted nucleic acid-binding protein